MAQARGPVLARALQAVRRRRAGRDAQRAGEALQAGQRHTAHGRTPAVEVMLNSRHIAELIEKGDMAGIKEAMEQSMSPGSQTFEQALFKLYREQVISLEEALANADSANNLHWLINNSEAGTDAKKEEQAPQETEPAPAPAPAASFSEFTLKI